MKARIAEWVWKMLVLAALVWIGLQLQRLHEDVTAPVDATTTADASDTLQESLDQIADDVEDLTKKVDAILVVMARAR